MVSVCTHNELARHCLKRHLSISMTGCTNKLFSNCVDVCINWGFEIPTELLLYLRRFFFFFLISISKTYICEKLKKKRKRRNVNLWWRKFKMLCLESEGYYSSQRQSKIKCSANWIFPVFWVGLRYKYKLYSIYSHTLCIIYMLLSSDHPKWITGAFHPLLFAFVSNVVSLLKVNT